MRCLSALRESGNYLFILINLRHAAVGASDNSPVFFERKSGPRMIPGTRRTVYKY